MTTFILEEEPELEQAVVSKPEGQPTANQGNRHQTEEIKTRLEAATRVDESTNRPATTDRRQHIKMTETSKTPEELKTTGTSKATPGLRALLCRNANPDRIKTNHEVHGPTITNHAIKTCKLRTATTLRPSEMTTAMMATLSTPVHLHKRPVARRPKRRSSGNVAGRTTTSRRWFTTTVVIWQPRR